MPRDVDVYQLLRAFAARNGLLEVEYRAFAQAVQRQARLADQGNPVFRDLGINPDTVLIPRLFLLARERKLALEAVGNEIRSLILPERFETVFREEYRRIDENPDVPFPDEDSLKIVVPPEWIQSVSLESDLGIVSDRNASRAEAAAGASAGTGSPEGLGVPAGSPATGEAPASPPLYRIVFAESIKPVVIPASFVPDKLLEYAILKLRQYLRRGGNKEYVYNKLLYSFSSKEILLKETFGAVLTKPFEAIAELKKPNNDLTYPFWAYLTSHVKKDLEKKTDKGSEDWSVVQAAWIAEFYANHYRGKAQRQADIQAAYKAFDLAIRKPPYNFSIEEVTGFRDSKGQSLIGKYTREQLEELLKAKTTKSDPGSLPELLVVATGQGRRSYVAKDRLLPLAVRLIGEARADLRTRLVEEWRRILEDFGSSPAMFDDPPYRTELASFLETRFPLLDALVQDRLLPLVYEELRGRNEAPPDLERLFYKGELVPLDELLDLPRKVLLADAKMLLPFWYTVPFFSSLAKFFRRLARGREARPAPARSQAQAVKALDRAEEAREGKAGGGRDRRAEFSQAAAAVAKVLVPSGYSLDEYLRDLEGRWNTLLNLQSKANLTEDVNSLVRDYLRGILRTMRGSSFTVERVRSLAATLADTPNLMKIKNHQALEQYIQAYMVKVLRR